MDGSDDDYDFPEDQIENEMSDGEQAHEEDQTPEEEIRQHMDYKKVVVVENLPKVAAAKFEKLKAIILKKLFCKAGAIVEDTFAMPVDEAGKTKGVAILEYQETQGAAKAVKGFNNYKFPPNLILTVRPFKELLAIVRPPKNLLPELPSPEKFPLYEDAVKMSKQELRSWLDDELVRDQYVIRYAKETEIHWCGRDPAAEGAIELEYGAEVEKADGTVLTEMAVEWSPRGSYLASFHPQGIALWGGPKVERQTKKGKTMSGWSKIKRFRHPNVASILFSPREKFLMCSDPRSASRVTVQFFELARPGRPRRTFYVKPNEETSMEAREDLFRPDSNDNSQNGPLFKWSHSERYFARKTLQNGGLLSVYETNEFKLLGRSSIKAKGISTFEWSPGAYNARDDQDNIVAYFTPEESNQAACLYIQEIPSRKILRSKPCFTVSNCQIFWQSNGDYLCAQVTRHSKTGKTEFTNFELCRLRGVNYPMEMLEIREPIAHFAWEPFGGYLFKNKGERFCIIHGDGPNKTVSFYTMAKTGKRSGRKKLALLFQLHKQTVNKIYWSPNGRHVVLHGSIQLVFVDVDKNEVLASPEHPHCNKIEWDPSGRFIVTAEEFDTVHGSSIEKSFRFWSFQGKPLHDEKRSKFMSFSWRPRPSQNLVMKIQPTKQEAKIPLEQRKPTMKDVIDNMSESRKRYIIQDNDVINTRVKAEALEKLKGREDFQNLLDEAELIMKQGYAQAGLPHPNDIPDDCQINIVCMEEFIDEKKEPVKWSTR